MEATLYGDSEKMELTRSKEISSVHGSYNATTNANKPLPFNGLSLADSTSCCKMSPGLYKVIEIVLLTVAIAITLIVFSGPIVAHTIVKYQEGDGTSTGNIKPFTCSTYSNISNCSAHDFTWGVTRKPDSCAAQVYTDSTCAEFLKALQSCAIGRSTNILVNVSTNMNDLKTMAEDILSVIQDSTCKEAAKPLLCQYLFPLCDCNTGYLYTATQEQCYSVSTGPCALEWALAEQYGFPVPDCSTLLPASPDENSSAIIVINNDTVNSSVTCGSQFYHNDTSGICQPECGKWTQSDIKVTYFTTAVQLMAALFGLITGSIVIVGSFIRYKSMLTFPSVFLLYMTGGYCVVGIFVVVSLSDQSVFCSSKNLNTSLYHPTTYCTVTGVVFHYFLINMSLWWFFHVLSLFYKVMFPITAKRFEKKQKYIHLLLLVVGVVVPVIPVSLVLSNSKWMYTATTFPASLCVPIEDEIFYYSDMVVLNAVIAIGMCLFILMFWVVHKHQGLFRASRKSKWDISTAERKLLFVLLYYIVFGMVTLIYFGISTAQQDLFINALKKYFACEALGGSCSSQLQEYQRYLYPYLAATTYLLMGFIPLVNLTFVINWRKCGQLVAMCSLWSHDTTKPNIQSVHSTFSPQPSVDDLSTSATI